MGNGERIKVEGKPTKRFRVYYTDIDNEPHECEGEYDTVDEVMAHRRRRDRRYTIAVGRTFMPWIEFVAWAKNHE